MTKIHVTFRIATDGDVFRLARFSQNCFISAFGHLYSVASLSTFLKEQRSETRFLEHLNDSNTTLFLVQTHQEEIVGYGLWGPVTLPIKSPPVGAIEIKQLYVDPNYQSRGIGKILLDKAIDASVGEETSSIYLGVYSENIRAQQFYERAGFKRVGAYDFPVGDHVDHEFIYEMQLP